MGRLTYLSLERSKKMQYQVVKELNGKDGFTYTDLVCYFGERRFVLVPLTSSKSARAYFYALLKGEAKK